MERVDGIDIVTTPEFKTSDLTQAFTTELDRHGRTFDITPDGSKLLVGITRETHEAVETRERITIVMGWFGELERRAR